MRPADPRLERLTVGARSSLLHWKTYQTLTVALEEWNSNCFHSSRLRSVSSAAHHSSTNFRQTARCTCAMQRLASRVQVADLQQAAVGNIDAFDLIVCAVIAGQSPCLLSCRPYASACLTVALMMRIASPQPPTCKTSSSPTNRSPARTRGQSLQNSARSTTSPSSCSPKGCISLACIR